jgi:hypothetical protein
MSDDTPEFHYLFAWLREYPQFHPYVVQQTRPDQEEPRYLLGPDAFYYHARWLYEHGKLTAEDLQHTVQWLDAYDNAPPVDDEL